MLTEKDLLREAETTGFRPEPLEKVILLIELLNQINSHPFLKSRIALKGGTALNLFLFDLPRLSVDIDLNYIGSKDGEKMKSERPQIEEGLVAVLKRQNLQIRRIPRDHAGGKWRLQFNSAFGRTGTLEIDVNFLLRVPLWPVQKKSTKQIGSYQATDITVVDEHALGAGKLTALLSRHASRDLFDARYFLAHAKFDRENLRAAFIVYGGISRKDWRKVSVEKINFEAQELKQQLVPLLRERDLKQVGGLTKWTQTLVKECQEALKIVLPFRDNEVEFFDRLLDQGEIKPELLTKDGELHERIRCNLGLNWKAQNVREFKKKL